MDLRKLELFVAVVDAGGFTAAAAAVHVAQPSISLAVRELERELRTPLLVRSRRGVELTAAGRALLGPARRALREVANAAAAVDEVIGLRAGRLDVASLPTLAADPVAALVGTFRRAHPEVAVGLLAPSEPSEVVDAVRSGRAEIGITGAGPPQADLDEIHIAAQELVVVSPPGSRTGRGALGLEQLATTPLVTTPPGTSLRTLVDDAFAAVGVEPVIAIETEQRDALGPLVLAGAGSAFLPAAVATTVAAQGAVVRATRPRIERRVVLLHRSAGVGPAARAFVEQVRRGHATRSRAPAGSISHGTVTSR
ncbi:MAG: LysR family transcriptional regulator [Acidimicrobiia bacterium]